MDIGNERKNKARNQTTSLSSKQPGQWKAVCGADQRFYFVNLETKVSQWLPPIELWSSKFGLPYGWEACLSKNSLKYYINHVNKNSTLEDPRSEADQVSTHLQMAATRARRIQIKRDPSLGFGFVAGSEKPVVIRSVISGGPSHGKLFSNDQILKVNGHDVSEVAQEHVISLIKSCIGELEIHVVSSEDLQDAKNQGSRRSSLMSRATRERRRSSPVNVRFADDMIQYIGPAEQARRSSLPVLPNVLKVFLENGQTRSFHYNPKTTVQEIFIALGPKLDIKAMEYFCLVLSGPHKNQLSFLQNHEKVSEIYLNRNCSRSSWVCKLRICFIPRDINELLEKDPVAFDYFYDQISKDIVEGLFEIDLRYDLAIKLAALHMQQKATEAKHKTPTKISVKIVEKDFDGLQLFIPANIINGVKLKDLRKVLDQQIKFNQSLAGTGQRYLTSRECKQQYLKLTSELVSYGGKYFSVILYSNDGGSGSGGNTEVRKTKHQEATVLVSPKYGLSRMVKGKINVLCQLAELEQISGFSISFHAEGKRLLTISTDDNKDLALLMKPLDSMDLVTFIVGYQKLWNCTTGKLTVVGERKEPLAPLTDHDIPPYATLHRVFPDSWSYPTFLQVPGCNPDHHFYLDLSKDPPKYTSPNEEPTDAPADEDSSVDVPSIHIAAKRFSEDINTTEGVEDEGVTSEIVYGKRLKVDNSASSNERGTYTIPESENDTEMTDSQSKARTLYSIAEESQNTNENKEAVDDDYISQLAFAEDVWRKNRNKKIEISLDDESSINNGRASQDIGNIMIDGNPDEVEKVKGSDEKYGRTNKSDDGEQNRITDSDDDRGEDDDVKRNSSDEEKKFRDNDKREGIHANAEYDDQSKESMEIITQDVSKDDDHGKLHDMQQRRHDELLDVNDIDIDDESGASTNDSLDLLADFSFAGELKPQDETKKPGADIKAGDDDDGDDGDDVDDGDDDNKDNNKDTLDLPKNKIEAHNSELSSSDVFVSSAKSKTDGKTKELEQEKHVDDFTCVDTFDSLSSEKMECVDEKVALDNSSNMDIDVKTLKDSELQKTLPPYEDDNHNYIDVDEVGIQILSYKQKEEQLKENDLSGDNNIMDGNIYLDKTISDSSFVTSKDSCHVVNAVDGDPRYQEDSNAIAEEERSNNTYLKVKNSSIISDVESLNDGFDTNMGSEGTSGLQNSLDEEEEFHRLEDALPGKLDQEDDTNDRSKDIISDEHEEGDTKLYKDSKLDESSTDATAKDLKDIESKSSISMVLFLGKDPGESEDTSDNFNKETSFEKNTDKILKNEKMEFHEFSLMDWIIPAPPGSTEELLDSDISVASPPPSCPSFDSISSPPVELDDNIFTEFEIDDMILPPPPMGSSFNSVIRIVSPPPSHLHGSTKKPEKPTTTRQCDVIPINSIDSNIQQLDKLTLDDSTNVAGEEFVPMNLAQSRSSESSGSVFTDDYNSGSISCYSFSNDSQMTSEDEFFDEERHEVFRDVEDQSNGNVALFNLLEPGVKSKDAEEVSLNAYEMCKIQQERTNELNSKAVNGEIIVAAQKESSLNIGHKEVVEQIPLRENTVLEILKNGLLYNNDYDGLDEVPFMVENDPSPDEGIDTKSPPPHLSQKRTELLPFPKADNLVIEKIDDPAKEIGTTLESSKTKQYSVEISTSKEGYVENRTNLFGSKAKPEETNTTKELYSPEYSPNVVENATRKKKYLNTRKHDKTVSPNIRSLDENNPSSGFPERVSYKKRLPKKQSSLDTTSLPTGYGLKYNKRSGKADMNLSLNKMNLEIKSEDKNDQRREPAKRTMNENLSTQNDKDKEDEIRISSEESRRIDDAGVIEKNYVSDKSGETCLPDKSLVDIKASRLSVQAETVDLTERLKLRLQGCVDDCQDLVLKSSHLPFVTNNKWKEGVHDNADCLAFHIKLLNKNVQEMNDEVIPTIKALREALQSLVSSFVLASTSQQRISIYSVRMLAGILNDVIYLHNDVIIKVEEAITIHPNKSKLKSVAEKTTTMTALIASLKRTLKRL